MLISCEHCRERLSELLEEDSPTLSGGSSPDSSSGVPGTKTRKTLFPMAASNNGLDRQELEAHVATCPSCARDLLILRHARQELRRLPMMAAPPDLRKRIQIQLQQEPTVAANTASNTSQVHAISNGSHHATGAGVSYRTRRRKRKPSPQESILQGIQGFFQRPSNMAWASGLAVASFCGILLFRSELPEPVLSNKSNDVVVQDTIVQSGEAKTEIRVAQPTVRKKAPSKTPSRPVKNSNKAGSDNSTMPELRIPDAVANTKPADSLLPPPMPEESPAIAPGSTSVKIKRHEQGSNAVGATSSNERQRTDFNKKGRTNKPSKEGPATAEVRSPVPNSHRKAETGALTSNTNRLSNDPPESEPKQDLVNFVLLPRTSQTQDNASATGSESVQGLPGTRSQNSHGPDGPAGPAGPAGPTNGNPPSSRINAAPPSVAPGTGTQTPTGAISNNFGRIGQTRQSHLTIQPPRDVQNARIGISLSSGLKFVNDTTAGGWQLLWQGAARKGEPIEIDLYLTAVAPGQQKIEVTLMEETTESSSVQKSYKKVGKSETITVNVSAR